MTIIGIDPGVSATGFGVLISNKKVYSGTIRPSGNDYYQKISAICNKIQGLLNRYQPAVVALEKAFYKKNVASLIKISEIRGALIHTLLQYKLKVVEFTPAQVKLAITGNGRATKRQVRFIIGRLLFNNKSKISQHAVDALAIAYTAQKRLR